MTQVLTMPRKAQSGPRPRTLPMLWLIAVAAMLVPEQYLAVRLAGWGFAGWRVWKRPEEGLMLLAFFTPMFDGFGVFPMGYSLLPIVLPKGPDQHALSQVFFSLKPVQILMLFLIGSLSLRKRLFFKDPLDWLVVGSLIGILGIGVMSGAFSPDPLKAFRVGVNFALLIILCKVLMSVMEDREQFWKMLHYYFLGVVFLCGVHLVNYFGDLRLFGQETMFNNHFGFLLSMSLPLALCLAFTRPEPAQKAWYIGVLVLGFFCSVLTLSRSSIYGSVISAGVFLTIFFARTPQWRGGIAKAGGIALLAAAGSLIFYDRFIGVTDGSALFQGKLLSFFKLFDPEYWRWAVFEDPNGGMFGERFVQLREVKALFLANPVLGEGWTNRVISFHGLLYTMLTGTGLMGASLFLYFLYRLFKTLWRASGRDGDARSRVLGIALFSALADWVMHCVLDTYFLQFHIWLILAMALSYIKTVGRGEASHA